MKLTLLGTGNAAVTKCYNTCFVLEENGEHFLVDAGGGNTVLSQLEKVGMNWKQMRHIFVTHKHIDHLLGIVWLVRLITQEMSRGKYEGEATIYGHEEVICLIRELAAALLQKKTLKHLDERLHLVTLEDGQEFEVLGCKARAFDIHSTKAKQFGFTLYYGEGKKLTCCGDEPYSEFEYDYAKDSDWLLHEAFCLFSQADVFKPYEKNHSTAKDACQLAEQLGVKNLVLYHTEDKNIEHRKELYTAEGKPYFSGNLYVPEDLESFEL